MSSFCGSDNDENDYEKGYKDGARASMNKPPDCVPHTPRKARVIDHDDGVGSTRIIVTRLSSDEISIELHRHEARDPDRWLVAFVKMSLADGLALAIALEDLAR